MEALKEATETMDMEVGRRVHMLMWDKGLTQTSLARRLNMAQSSLAKKLRGTRGWSLDDVRNVAKELGTTVAYLFGETENPQPDKPTGGMEPPAGIEPATNSLQGSHLAEVLPFRRAS